MLAGARTHDRASPDPPADWRARVAEALRFGPRETIALVVVGAAVLAGALFAHARARPVELGAAPAAPAEVAAASPSAAPAPVVVHVAGAVRSPGVYELAAGARVWDAVQAAGGPVADAEVDAINLARPLGDGERIYVPRRGEGPPGAGGAGGGDGGPLDLNTATAAQLETLPGIGPVLAARIVDYREQHGRFRSVRDLLKVAGIGPKKFASIEPHVRV